MPKQLKSILVFLSISQWCCAPYPQCPEGSRLITIGEYPRIATPDSSFWTVITDADLSNYCRKERLHYVGTLGVYHLLRHLEKIQPRVKGEIVQNVEWQFAISIESYKPDSIFSYPMRRIISQPSITN